MKTIKMLVSLLILLAFIPTVASSAVPPFNNRGIYHRCHHEDQIGNCLGAKKRDEKLPYSYNSSDAESNKCIKMKEMSCDYVIRFNCNEKAAKMVLELFATRKNASDSGWVAGGISEDRKMGTDLVVSCMWDRDKISGQFSYNVGRTNIPRNVSFFSVTKLNLTATDVFCNFTLAYKKIKIYDNGDFQFENVRNILVAGGPVRGGKMRHHDARMSSAFVDWHHRNNVSNEALAPSYYPERFHGMYMIICWVTWIPTGSFVARFYKESWIQKHLLKKRIWIFVHAGCLLIGLIMSSTSCISVMFDRSHVVTPSGTITRYHGMVGAAAFWLLFIQCGISWLRPTEGIARQVYSKVHCLVGHVIYVLGLINIITASKWTYNVAPIELALETYAWIGIHLFMHTCMVIYFEWSDKHLQIGGHRALLSYPLPIVSTYEAPRRKLRNFILIGFFSVSVAMSAIMIGTLFNLPIPNRHDFDFEEES